MKIKWLKNKGSALRGINDERSNQMKFKKIAVLFFALCFMVLPAVSGCEKEGEDLCMEKYVIIEYTDTYYETVTAQAPMELPFLFGANDEKTGRLVGAGFIGPMLLNWTIEQMQACINAAFDMAEQYNIPVYFQVDDCNSYTDALGSIGNGDEVKYWENPAMCEWTSFPEEGETWGGQAEALAYQEQTGKELPYGGLPRFWFNWGNWLVAKPFPNFASPELQELVVNNLKKGVLEPLVKRYNELKKQGKGYLFAGIAIGWETHIPNNEQYKGQTIVNYWNNEEVMREDEQNRYGYAALTSLGYDQKRLETMAALEGVTVDEKMDSLLWQVIHDYTELLAKTAYEAGLPKEKIYSHIVSITTSGVDPSSSWPPIWTAVNDYCTPGFTMNRQSCPYDLDELKKQIKEADSDQEKYGLVEGYDWSYADSLEDSEEYLQSIFGSGSNIITCFGWPTCVKNYSNKYVQAVKNWKYDTWGQVDRAL